MHSRFNIFLLAVYFISFLTACTSDGPAASEQPGSSTFTASPISSNFVKSPSPLSPSASTRTSPEIKITSAAAANADSIGALTPSDDQTKEKISDPTPDQPPWTETINSPTPTASLTPTFDRKSIRTSTPAPAAKCPKIETRQVPTLEYNHDDRLGVEDAVFLDYLNQFGPDAFLQADQTTIDSRGRSNSRALLQRDLTNDGVPEIVVSFGPLYIFGWKDGKYQTLLATEQSARNIFEDIIAINDLNQNGIPELLVLLNIGTQDDHYYQLFEWGDGKFNSLLSPSDWSDSVFVLSGGSFEFQDVEHDGMKEIVLHNGSPLSADNYGYGLVPWRRITKIYKWDGEHFALTNKYFDPPQYRLQAVEDADHAVLNQAYNQALGLYQQVIFNDRLEWWTQMRKIYIVQQKRARGQGESSPGATPAPDPNEYLYLSAYARFRIMVLHLLRGYDSDAQVVYQTLLRKYPDGTPGSIYAKMAQAFWKSYEKAHSLEQACGEARAALKGKEEEATRYLYDDYGDVGWGQSNYRIDQLCPFHP